MTRRVLLSSMVGLLPVWFCAVPLSAAEDAGVPAPREGFPSVYVDRTHEWLFAYDDLAIKMLLPIGFDVILPDRSFEATRDLSRQDVVVLIQFASPSALSTAEERLLLAYVKGGGRLLLVTNSKPPARRLAQSLGFGFRPGGRKMGIRPIILHSWPRKLDLSPMEPPEIGLIPYGTPMEAQ